MHDGSGTANCLAPSLLLSNVDLCSSALLLSSFRGSRADERSFLATLGVFIVSRCWVENGERFRFASFCAFLAVQTGV